KRRDRLVWKRRTRRKGVGFGFECVSRQMVDARSERRKKPLAAHVTHFRKGSDQTPVDRNRRTRHAGDERARPALAKELHAGGQRDRLREPDVLEDASVEASGAAG